MSTLSDRLKELRGPSSQAEMARQLGMKQPQWARYESGASSPSVELLSTICRVHECSADWLLGLDSRNRSVTVGAGAAVAIGAGAKASARTVTTPGECAACSKCPHLKKLKKLEALLSK